MLFLNNQLILRTASPHTTRDLRRHRYLFDKEHSAIINSQDDKAFAVDPEAISDGSNSEDSVFRTAGVHDVIRWNDMHCAVTVQLGSIFHFHGAAVQVHVVDGGCGEEASKQMVEEVDSDIFVEGEQEILRKKVDKMVAGQQLDHHSQSSTVQLSVILIIYLRYENNGIK